MKERLKMMMEERQMNARQFAEEIGVQPSSISHILTGRNKPSIELIQKLLDRYPDVDVRFLITGVRQTSTVADGEIREESIDETDSPSDSSEKTFKSERIVVFFNDGTYRDYLPR